MTWNQHEKLEKAKRTTIEMEGISLEVMKQLEHQTGQMKGIGGKVNDMNQNIDESNSLLKRMMKRQNRNKTIVVTCGALMAVSLIVILCLKFI